jgi:hypothetical protein
MSWCNYVHGCHDSCQRDAQVLIVEVKKSYWAVSQSLLVVRTWVAMSQHGGLALRNVFCVLRICSTFNIDNSQPVMHEDADDKIMEDDTV